VIALNEVKHNCYQVASANRAYIAVKFSYQEDFIYPQKFQFVAKLLDFSEHKKSNGARSCWNWELHTTFLLLPTSGKSVCVRNAE
jgi:hypothetical protein